jgi:hypothetical protein
MRFSLLSIPLLLVVAFALPPNLYCQAGLPMISTVDPASGKIGDVLMIQGANLGQDTVAGLYLTDGKTDVKVLITEQTPTSIRFRIPREAKPGRFALMVLTMGADPKLIEQPVKVTVESETTGSTNS